ncbi:MAG TPA: choice-of-anchor Q domain-containing protein, partial [Polyangiaceae bacterium]|nr:choice-of-anchor Q domain-containing protein [Polyangiaceae bacterium]
LGATGLPTVATRITIEGNGSTIVRDAAAPDFRIFSVWSASGELTLNETTVSGGSALDGSAMGGGIYAAGDAQVTLNDCVISGNSSDYLGSAIGGNDAAIELKRTTVIGNSGDWQAVSAWLGNVSVEQSAVVQNDGGGVFGYYADVDIDSSTISGNDGAGVEGPWVDVTGSTVSGNTDAGIVVFQYFLTLRNSIVSGNGGPLGRELEFLDTLGFVQANMDHNVLGHDGDAGLYNLTPHPTDIVVAGSLASIMDPALAANGGPTLTHLLRADSPARDTGHVCAATDQRGVSRPQGAACDIGAVELVGDRCATSTPSTGCTVNGVAGRRCLGTSGNDVIVGTSSNDVIFALAGDDKIYALGGDDIICASDGADSLYGGGGNDILSGGPGQDSLSGDPGADTLNGGTATDACSTDDADVSIVSCN